MFKKLDWLAYPERVKYKKAVLVFKSINSLAPQYMASLFTPHVQIRETRQSAEKDTENSLCTKGVLRLEFCCNWCRNLEQS